MTRILLFLFATILLAGCSDETSLTSQNSEDVMEENMTLLRMGPFVPLAAGKAATGSATLRTLDTGMLRLDFSDNFSLTDGPGLFVFLSNSEFISSDAVNLGAFISPSGSQMYSLPDGVSLDSFTHVAVHCIPYNVTFAAAELK